MSIERPTGPYAFEMTAGAAWPTADEDSYFHRAEELHGTLVALTEARQQWEHHRDALFGDGAVWSGRAADAATAEIDDRTGSMHEQEENLRIAIDQANRTGSAIVEAKKQVTDNVQLSQLIITQVSGFDSDEFDGFIQHIVVATFTKNVQVIASAAAGLKGPGARKATKDRKGEGFLNHLGEVLGEAAEGLDKASKSGNLADGLKAGLTEASDDLWKRLRWLDPGPQRFADPGAARAVLATDLASLEKVGGKIGKFADRAWVIDAVGGVAEFASQGLRTGNWLEAVEDHLPKTAGSIAGGLAGAEIGAAIGSIVPGAGTVIGAGVGAAIGGLVASDMGKAAGQAISDGIDAFEAAGSWSEKLLTVPQTLVSSVSAAGGAALDDITGAADAVSGGAKAVWRFLGG